MCLGGGRRNKDNMTDYVSERKRSEPKQKRTGKDIWVLYLLAFSGLFFLVVCHSRLNASGKYAHTHLLCYACF